MTETDRRPRARDAGIVVGALPVGPHNAITDVAGVEVGHATVVRGSGPTAVRTGVTVVLPGKRWPGRAPVFAAPHRLNGNGEMTGLAWVRESGTLTSPVAITNTHSVGVVRDALIRAELREAERTEGFWRLPVVAETYDGLLNDINGFHVTADHVDHALQSCGAGPVEEGCVGGGTGMICHGFKGGIGTSSRMIDVLGGRYTVGVLVQANHGRRERLRINGAPVGESITDDDVPVPRQPSREASAGEGSIIVVVGTDAPLLPHQCARLAQRAGLGIARVGGVGENASGDLFLAFATGNDALPSVDNGADVPDRTALSMVPESGLTAFFDAVVEATEESIVNALCAARTTEGRHGTAYQMPTDRVAAWW